MTTCRLCKKSDFEPHKYRMIQYAVRHNAHADCALAKWGAEFFARLTPWQLTQFPVIAAFEAGLLGRLQDELEARPYPRANHE